MFAYPRLGTCKSNQHVPVQAENRCGKSTKAAHLVATHLVSFLPVTGQPPCSACLSKVPLTCRL